MAQNTKLIVMYVVLGIVVFLLVIVNYYHEGISTYVPVPGFVYPLFSLTCAVFMALFFLHREKEVERERYEFVSIATHKFRTPLTGIKWAIEAMAQEITYEEKTKILQQLRNATNHLIEIIDLLVNFAKIDSSLSFAFEAASMREMVQDSVVKFSTETKQKNIRLTINSDPDIPFIVIDKQKIQFVIDMLIDNAIKYTPANGAIEISLYKDKNTVIFKVQDSGIGMTDSDINNLFKKFYRGDDARRFETEGMGLGLYAAKRIVDRHSGTIKAESAGKNQGSSFYLILKLGKNYTS